MSELNNRPDDSQIGMSARQSFVLLALLFLAPLLIAWLMLFGGKGLMPEGTTNHGTLVQPPRTVTLPDGIRTTADLALPADYIPGKWTMIYIGDADCDDSCLQNIYKMRQTRLAQNENVRRVQRLFLVTTTGVPAAFDRALENYPGMDVALLSPEQVDSIMPFFRVDDAAVSGAERIYLVDPLGYLMMYYAPDAEAKGILQDLKKLLKYSQIG